MLHLHSLYFTPCEKVTAAASAKKAHVTLSWFYFEHVESGLRDHFALTTAVTHGGLRSDVYSYMYTHMSVPSAAKLTSYM